MARAVEAATAAGVQGDLMTRRDEFTNHAQSWRRAAVGAGATLVGWLRESASYDPRFAFVALDGDRIVGHVATGGDLDGAPTLGLGPLSVEPSRQGQGIGS
ncbi:GNAT family N-acetyltransferase [Dermacoccus nishinomiyaensis]|uniref:GNAT family N-acetyltransferase n=2 Tax=Dermacoccus nishinomiyaensis TaxID=1274 RepID=UPI0030B94551